MAEEAPTVVNDQVADTTPTDSTPAETQQSPDNQVSDEFLKGWDAEADTKSEPETEEEDLPAQEETPEETDGKKKGAEARIDELNKEIEEAKEQLGIDPNTQIRDLVSARNAIREAVEQVNNQVYQPQSEEDLVNEVNPDTGDYYNPLEAKIKAMEQREQAREYNAQVADAQLTIQTEAQRALQDFPMFDEKSPEYDAAIASQVDALAERSLIRDPNTGLIVGTNQSLYQLYKTVADANRAAITKGEIKGQAATEKMLSNADVKSSARAATSKTDPFLEGFLSDD